MQKLAVLDKECAKALYMQKDVLDNRQKLWAAPSDITLANSPQDYIGGFEGGAPNVFSIQKQNAMFVDRLKNSEADNSDQESGVADFSCHSSGEESLQSEDSVKDPDSDGTGSGRA